MTRPSLARSDVPSDVKAFARRGKEPPQHACRTPGQALARPGGKDVGAPLFWRRKYGILKRLGQSRPDVQLVASLRDRNRVSLDIGADVGEFAIAMLASSRSVIAFEPRPPQARDLASMFKAVGAPVRVEAVALSDKPGLTAMRVLEYDPGRSTIDDSNPLTDTDGSAVQTIDVPVKRLDDLRLDDVGMVKIDVEGHEQHQNAANIGSWQDGWAARGVYVNNFAFLPGHVGG